MNYYCLFQQEENPVAALCGEILYNLRFDRMLRLAHMYDDQQGNRIFTLAPSRESRVTDELMYVALASIEYEQGIDALVVCGNNIDHFIYFCFILISKHSLTIEYETLRFLAYFLTIKR